MYLGIWMKLAIEKQFWAGIRDCSRDGLTGCTPFLV